VSTFALDQIQAQLPRALVQRYEDRTGAPWGVVERGSIAEIEKKTGRLILHVQSQTPGSTRDLLAESVLKRPKESVRVLVGDIGGGFGQKIALYREELTVAAVARHLKRPVRWREVRPRGDARLRRALRARHGRARLGLGIRAERRWHGTRKRGARSRPRRPAPSHIAPRAGAAVPGGGVARVAAAGHLPPTARPATRRRAGASSRRRKGATVSLGPVSPPAMMRRPIVT